MMRGTTLFTHFGSLEVWLLRGPSHCPDIGVACLSRELSPSSLAARSDFVPNNTL